MFERIMSITENFAIVKVSNNINVDILNYNIIFEDNERKILGEICEIVNDEIKIAFLGEFVNNTFFCGIIRRPTLNSKVRFINQQELGELVNTNSDKSIILGTSPLYNNYPIKVNINEFFGNHTAIIGNSGTGKTYGVTRIIQNFFYMKDRIPFNSNIFIFNNTYEYYESFKEINKVNKNLNYKLYTCEKNSQFDTQIKIPLWLMGVEDFVNILDVNDSFQITVIKKMLYNVNIFAKNDKESIKYKNYLIAKAIFSILYSNQLNTKIREKIFKVLTICFTEQLSLDVEVPGIGYKKSFRKCFEIDNNGEFVERSLITKYIQNFIENVPEENNVLKPVFFTLNQLETALNFTLISDDLLFNDKIYQQTIELKDKLHAISHSSINQLFDVQNFITLEQYIDSLSNIDNNGKAQIVNFVLEGIDDKFAKSIVKIIFRILVKYAKNKMPNEIVPINIILEDAHKYVHKDSDIDILGYNIFERVAKDGRKFGIIMNLVTQWPTELSESVLSQCSNFIIFKLDKSTDLEFISKFIPNINLNIIEKQKILQTGTCIVFGNILQIPIIVKMQMPDPATQKTNTYIYDKWMVEWKN